LLTLCKADLKYLPKWASIPGLIAHAGVWYPPGIDKRQHQWSPRTSRFSTYSSHQEALKDLEREESGDSARKIWRPLASVVILGPHLHLEQEINLSCTELNSSSICDMIAGVWQSGISGPIEVIRGLSTGSWRPKLMLLPNRALKYWDWPRSGMFCTACSVCSAKCMLELRSLQWLPPLHRRC
jgi:hypothetical protein